MDCFSAHMHSKCRIQTTKQLNEEQKTIKLFFQKTDIRFKFIPVIFFKKSGGKNTASWSSDTISNTEEAKINFRVITELSRCYCNSKYKISNNSLIKITCLCKKIFQRISIKERCSFLHLFLFIRIFCFLRWMSPYKWLIFICPMPISKIKPWENIDLRKPLWVTYKLTSWCITRK